MNPLQRIEHLFQEMVASQLRSELYLHGIFSIEVARLGMIDPEQLAQLLASISESIAASVAAQEERRKETMTWRAKNLAA